MQTNELRQSIHDFLSLLAGYTYGTWQFWVTWGVGVVIVLLFGKAFARGIVKSEKSFITIFIGNSLIAILMLAAAWATDTYAGPHLEDGIIQTVVTCTAAALTGFFLVLILAKIFWAESRWAAFFACIFTLALGYGGMFATAKVLALISKGQDSIEQREVPGTEAPEPKETTTQQ